jgi:exosome complex RNA-binding protein Csl4
MTETVVNTEAGRQWATRIVGIEGNQTAAGNYRLAAVMTVQELLNAKASLNESQKQAFAKAVGDMVAAQIYALLTSGASHRGT